MLKTIISILILILLNINLKSQDCFNEMYEAYYPDLKNKIGVKFQNISGENYVIFYAPMKKCFGETDQLIFWNKDTKILQSFRNIEENCFGKMKFKLTDELIGYMLTKQIFEISFNDSMTFKDSYGIFSMALELFALCVTKE